MKFQFKTRNPKGFPHLKALGWLVQLLAWIFGAGEELLAAAPVTSGCPSHPSGSPARRQAHHKHGAAPVPQECGGFLHIPAHIPLGCSTPHFPNLPLLPSWVWAGFLARSSCFANCSSKSRELLVQEASLRFMGENWSRSCLGVFLPDGADAFQERGRC